MARGIFRPHEDLWAEKYRPQTLNEYLGEPTVKEKFREIVDGGLQSNLLLSGDPGIGKSTFAHILVKALDCDFKYINASDENNIDTVRSKISNFCVTTGFSDTKIMVLDEFGNFTQQAQQALKSVMEQFISTTKFILTCNEIENVHDAIASRTQHFHLIGPDKVQVRKKCFDILKAEGVDYEEDEVDTIIDFNYPDMRKTINDLQKQVVNKVLKLDRDYFKLLNTQSTIVDLLSKVNDKNMFESVIAIRQAIADARIKKFNRLYRYLFENTTRLCKTKQHSITIPVLLAKYSYQDKDAPDKEINLIGCLMEIAEALVNN